MKKIPLILSDRNLLFSGAAAGRRFKGEVN